MRLLPIFTASALALLLTACPKDKAETMTQAEARDALDESTADTQASSLTTSSVELSTSFTIGKAASDAAAELKTFIATQLPCAEITLADATLSVQYGARPGSCVYKGHTFSGSHTIKVSRNEDEQVLVDHTWTDLSNGIVNVTGTAHVTWDLEEKSRKVEHDVTWTRLSDGRTGRGTGDRTQTPLAGGVAEGIQVDGSRTWTGRNGRWDLAIEGVQMRWSDPVPQAGTYRLASPKGRSLALSFRRIDADSIEVTLASGTRTFTFTVNAKGDVADRG
jgi:hypothetical protein